ncbi:MAG TPA: HIT domain-containing protein [Pirellulales bacterium]|nr:HIT domain-containing protein [Pirellulales bacterium]
MSDEKLWAPWRLAYITGVHQRERKAVSAWNAPPGAEASCFLCRAAFEGADRANLVVGRGPQSIVVLNRFPYNNGHLLIAPLAHHARLDEFPPETHLEMLDQMRRATQAIERLMNAQGFNIGVNLGAVAGAGVPGHLHWHIVPRWPGDTNFMPAVAAVDVIPQSLEALYELLAPALADESKDVRDG